MERLAAAATKKYNYLTTERLVNTKAKRLTRAQLRERDDKAYVRNRLFRQQLLNDVRDRIHYFEPFITRFVFFPQMRDHGPMRTFRGSVALAPRTYLRVYMHVAEQLLSGQRRPQLLELFALANIDAPSEREWAEYTDPVTGDVNIGLSYSRWLRDKCEWYIARVHYERQCRAEGIELRAYKPPSPFDAYVFLHYGDRQRVPSLRDWSLRQGPLQASELLSHTRSHARVQMLLYSAMRELRTFPQAELQLAVAQLSVEQRNELLNTVKERREELAESMQRQQLFAAKVTLALGQLPEIRAIRSERTSFSEEYECRWIIANKGRLWPRPPCAQRQWQLLSKEERLQYTCFGRRQERHPTSPMQLFSRYLLRDYGYSRYQVSLRYLHLSDVQRAALAFPFYLPITPRLSHSRPFQRFVHDMAGRFGFSPGAGPPGNVLFDIAMRERWAAMTPEEQRKYEDKDDFVHIFPLQPSSSSTATTTATATTMSDDSVPATDTAAAAAGVTATVTATDASSSAAATSLSADSAPVADDLTRDDAATRGSSSSSICDDKKSADDGDDDDVLRRAERNSRSSRRQRRRVQLLQRLLSATAAKDEKAQRLLKRNPWLRHALARLRARRARAHDDVAAATTTEAAATAAAAATTSATKPYSPWAQRHGFGREKVAAYAVCVPRRNDGGPTASNAPATSVPAGPSPWAAPSYRATRVLRTGAHLKVALSQQQQQKSDDEQEGKCLPYIATSTTPSRRRVVCFV